MAAFYGVPLAENALILVKILVRSAVSSRFTSTIFNPDLNTDLSDISEIPPKLLWPRPLYLSNEADFLGAFLESSRELGLYS